MILLLQLLVLTPAGFELTSQGSNSKLYLVKGFEDRFPGD